MKRLCYALLALLTVQLPASAQQADVRTTTTKIADLLALQPSETSIRLDEAMKQMERFTANDISALLTQLSPPGEGNNAGIEYATNSYSYYVLAAGKSQQRATFIEGAIDGLSKLANRDNKGFVIQLLQNAGDDRAVDALSKYLADTYLNEKASRALARIGTESAGSVLVQALEQLEGESAIPLIDALGFMAYRPAEKAILAKATSPETSLRRIVLYALSQIGGDESQSFLADAAQAAEYRYEPTQATAAYINYLHKRISAGDLEAARKAATKLFNAASQPDQVHTRIAALGLLTEANKESQTKALIKASRDENTVYRNAALGLLSSFLNDGITRKLVSRLSKTDTSAQVDILRYAAAQQQSAALPEVRKGLSSPSVTVRNAAAEALHQLDPEGADETLISLLSESESETRQTIKQILLTSKNPSLTKMVTDALKEEKNVDVQVLLIEVIGHRGAGDSMPIILDLIGEESKAVKDAAFKV